ncbi:MAG TPA: hypothetical protein DEP28_09700 [Bacteroidetes bacterium]|nr:hypothetical protein [Bacteroidota bacterium]HCN36971.1 hypothetical protein [Bacteroidota bacterium]
MKKFGLFFVIILSLTVLFTIAGGRKKKPVMENNVNSILTPLQEPDIVEAVQGDWVIKQEMSDAEKLNPVVTNDATADEIISYYLFEKLLSQDRVTYELVPEIAKELPVLSEDHLTYTFDIKENIKFSDGSPLTGEDIIFTFKAIKNPFTDAQALRNYFVDLERVELVDGNKFKVKFVFKQPYFRAIYAVGDIKIVPKHLLDPEKLNDRISFEMINESYSNLDPAKYPDMKKFADFLNSQEVSRSPKYVVGSGPYKLESWTTGQQIVLIRNDNWWNKDEKVYPKKIIFKTITDQNAAIVSAKNKEIDLMYVVQPVDFVENVKEPEKFGLKKALVLEPVYSYIGWNNASPLFSDPKVRMAMSYAIDRASIIEKIFYGMAVPIQSHVFYKSEYYDSTLPIIPFDLEKSKQLLSEAGWKDTDGDGILDKIIDGKKVDFKFTFTNNNNPTRRKIALIIIDALKQIGISADIQDYEWSVFLDRVKRHNFDAAIMAWQLSTGPEDPYQIWHSSQSQDKGSNTISYSNPRSDELIELNRVTFDDSVRKIILKEWQEIIYKDQPYTFLWTPTGRYLYSDRFKNTRWYSYPSSPLMKEWWSPKSLARYN